MKVTSVYQTATPGTRYRKPYVRVDMEGQVLLSLSEAYKYAREMFLAAEEAERLRDGQ